MQVVQKLHAKNDTNGNSRILWLVYNLDAQTEADGFADIEMVVLGENRPDPALIDIDANAIDLPPQNVATSTYRFWREVGRRRGILIP